MAMSRQLQFDLRPSPVVLRLIIANVALWLLMLLLGDSAERLFVRPYLMVSSDGVVSHFYVWQPFTYMWLHDTAGIAHILFNMVGLFFLGPPLERRWGQRTFLKFYLLTGVIAGFFSVLVGLLIPSFDVPTLGASGSLLGLLAAWSMVLPNTQILLFFVLPVRTRYIVWIAIGLDLVVFFSSSSDSTRVGVHTHIGGALAGCLVPPQPAHQQGPRRRAEAALVGQADQPPGHPRGTRRRRSQGRRPAALSRCRVTPRR